MRILAFESNAGTVTRFAEQCIRQGAQAVLWPEGSDLISASPAVVLLAKGWL